MLAFPRVFLLTIMGLLQLQKHGTSAFQFQNVKNTRLLQTNIDGLCRPRRQSLLQRQLLPTNRHSPLEPRITRQHYAPINLCVQLRQDVNKLQNRCERRCCSANQSRPDSHDTESESTHSEVAIGSPLLDTIRHAFCERILPLFHASEAIVAIVGVSGGCDSVGLLHALVQLNLPNLNLHAVHFDHKQRGSESDGDRLFVEQLCLELQIPLHTYYWDESRGGEAFSQDAARHWRRTNMYQLLLQTLKSDQERGVLLTAHHRDDSTETLLLKLLRGVHITNLVGMDTISELSDTPRAIWARPLLGASKHIIQEFLISQHLSWREDASNASSKYKRNRVRNELVPLLADIVGSQELLNKRLGTLAQQSMELRDDLTHRAHAYLQESQSDGCFLLPSSIPLALIHREALHLWSKQSGIHLSNDQLQRVCTQLEMYPNSLQWTLQIRDGWNIVRNGATLSIYHDGDTDRAAGTETPIDWCLVEGEIEADSKYALFIWLNEVPSDDAAFVVSTAGQVKNTSFIPSWKSKPIKVKEFLRGQKIPLHQRDQAPVIRQGDNVVAVFVNGKWEVDSALHHGSVCVKISLPNK